MKCLCIGAALAMLATAAAAPASAAELAPPAPAAAAPVAAADTAYSAAGLYNLANSYARAGKPGLAVLNYERAALLAPNDPDIQANLEHVRSTAHVPTAARGRLENLAHRASPTMVALIGVLGLLVAAASLLANSMFRKQRPWWILGCLAGVAAIGFTLGNALYWEPKIHEAVVIGAGTPIRATPVPMGDPLQQLAEAETVAVTQAHEDFVLVRTASGRRGWVARADLADVVPQSPAR
jgi:hypothetical protein